VTTFRIHEATCPTCGHRWPVEVPQGLHITRLPEVREQLKAGTFQIHTCPGCAAKTFFETPAVYTDFAHNEYLAVETVMTAGWQAAIARHQTVWRNCFEQGPPVAQEMGARMKRRLVYGYRALREKLVLWDAGLDDRIVEAVKGDLLREEEDDPRELVLRLHTILDGGHLLFAVYDPVERPEGQSPDEPLVIPSSTPHDLMTATRDRYDARAAAPSQISQDYPWVHDDWLVDVHDGPSYLYL